MACKLNNPSWVNSPPLSKVIDLTQGKVLVVLAIFDIIFLLVLLLFFIKNAKISIAHCIQINICQGRFRLYKLLSPSDWGGSKPRGWVMLESKISSSKDPSAQGV
jgi:hypothetical protein